MDKMIIHSEFERVAKQFPEKIAVEDSSRCATYQELNAYANRLAHAMAELSVNSKSIVTIFLDASIQYIAAMLGVLKTGAIFMPLNTKFPDKRVESIINKTNPRFFITGHQFEVEFYDKLKKLNLSVSPDRWIVLGEAFNFNVKDLTSGNPLANNHDFPDENPQFSLDPNNGCYIMTTSGSTGEPKAILGSQKGLSHFISWEISEFGLNQDVRVSLLSPVTFDVSLRDIFVPLVAGGTLCIPDEEARRNPGKLFRWMRQNNITLTHIVPTLFRLLTHEIEDLGGGNDVLPNLEYVLIAGEALYGSDIIKWRQNTGNLANLINIYGPTETTLAKCFYRITTNNFKPTEIVPLGKPIPDTEVLIIKDNKLCDVGETGEIYIKTPFMSKGYYNDPKLNEKSFVQNPLVKNQKDIIYKTGDLGKLMPDINLRFEGRVDEQIKLYGNRIEIAEIEVVLNQHPQVRQTAITLRDDAFGNKRLVAYVVTQPGEQPAIEALRGHIKDRLPDYMIPALFITLSALPLTHNGKIDRLALPEPDTTRPQMEQVYVSPSNGWEKTLSKIWSHVLGFNRIGVNDNFFDLGGNSILAAKLVVLVQEELGIELPIVKLFQYPKISLLAKFLSQNQSDDLPFEKAKDRAQRRRAVFLQHRRSKARV